MNLQIVPVHHVPEIAAGMNLAECLRDGVKASGLELADRDILAVTQKVISKAEGRIVRLAGIEPSARSVSIPSPFWDEVITSSGWAAGRLAMPARVAAMAFCSSPLEGLSALVTTT